MYRMVICAFMVLVYAPSVTLGAVTVLAGATGVQYGGDLTFTATTDETDPVVKVTFTYEGTSDSDDVASAPYQITKTMNWTWMQDLTVTATFDFQNISDQQGTVDVDVVDIGMYHFPAAVRGNNLNIWAYSRPLGISVDQWDWTYDLDNGGGLSDPVWTDTSDTDGKSNWSGTIALSGSAQVTATVLGVPCSQALALNVQPRTGSAWTTPVACAEDNDPNWGGPLIGLGEILGELHDKDTGGTIRVIVPQVFLGDWSGAVTLSQITGGPNAGVWYVQSNVLKIDMETVINQFAKAGGPPPAPEATNFFDHNNAPGGCIENDMDDFVQAIKNHEYRGTPPAEASLEGHFGRIEYRLDQTGDPAAAIEDKTASSEALLMSSVNSKLGSIESELNDFTAEPVWAWEGFNWGGPGSLGSGMHTEFDDLANDYFIDCTFGPDMF